MIVGTEDASGETNDADALLKVELIIMTNELIKVDYISILSRIR